MSTTPEARPAAVAVTHAEISAALCSRACDDEGKFDSMLDLLGFSGENKAYTVMRAALEAAAQVRAGQDHGGDAAEMIGEVERLGSELKRLAAENDILRASTANGLGPCAYCTLPRSRWAECEHGFPGCPRSDDAMLCPHVGAELETADKLAAAEARAAKAVEVLRHMEWLGYRRQCPVCRRYQPGYWGIDVLEEGHSPDCELATLLSDHPAPEPGVEAGPLGAIDDFAHSKILNGPRYSGETREWEAGATHGFRHAMIEIRDRIRALQTPEDGGRDGK